MKDRGVYLGGEGRNELGSRIGSPIYQSDAEPGVVESLLRRVRFDGWRVAGASQWCRITKMRSRGPTPKEAQNVLGLALEAKRTGAEILAFIRDEDGDSLRSGVIEDAIIRAKELFPALEIIGGVAVPVLEAWLLALKALTGTEFLSKAAAQSKLTAQGLASKDTAAMVRIVESAQIENIPMDAKSLNAWMGKARKVLLS